jgi:hypothetical protein
MSLRTLVPAFLIAAALAGCDPPPERASSVFDGTYVGTIELTGNNNHPTCPKSASAQLSITGGMLEYTHYSGAAFIQTTAHADGSFSGWGINKTNSSTQRVDGKILGDSVEAIAQNQFCKYQVNLKRINSQ